MKVQVQKIVICDFCDKNEKEVDALVVGLRDVAICDDCARLCVQVVEERASERLAYRRAEYDELGPITNFARCLN
jgi:ATP-dependent protease Clp ATPase subunit